MMAQARLTLLDSSLLDVMGPAISDPTAIVGVVGVDVDSFDLYSSIFLPVMAHIHGIPKLIFQPEASYGSGMVMLHNHAF